MIFFIFVYWDPNNDRLVESINSANNVRAERRLRHEPSETINTIKARFGRLVFITGLCWWNGIHEKCMRLLIVLHKNGEVNSTKMM